MEIEYYGGNCLKFTSKKANLVVDDNLSDLGLKSVAKEDSIVLITATDMKHPVKQQLIIEMPGEYEASDVSITGIAAKPYGSKEDKLSSTMYKIIISDIRILITGHVSSLLSDKQAEDIGSIDILVVPVGNNDVTLSGKGALRIIKKIEPKIVIPTHYSEKGIKYPTTQQSLNEAVAELSMDVKERVDSLKIKPADLPETLQLVVLNRS